MSMDFALFEKRLLETMTFCHHLLEEKKEHAILWDAIAEKSELLSKSEIDKLNSEDWSARTTTLFEIRAKYLETLYLFGELPMDREGKIIIYFPDLTLFDGTAELCSEGFFNFYDAPPPSTWLYFVEGNEGICQYIIAWVPSECLQLATFGVEVICCGATIFLDDAEFKGNYKTQIQTIWKELRK
jgi:hypothetical protein